MKTLLVLAASILVASAANVLDEEWNIWKSDYDKKYNNNKEESFRRRIWEENWQKVQKHNSLAEAGLRNYTLAMNMFADMTVPELTQRRPCDSKRIQRKPDPNPKSASNSTHNGKNGELVDWRKTKCVTSVKDAGIYCPAWWAFGMVGVLESRYCIKHDRLYKFSEQQLIDCNGENEGCCSGTFQSNFKYVSEFGVMTSKNYGYKAGQLDCQYDPKKAMKIKVSKYYTLIGEESIASAVAEDGPVAVTIGVTPEFFLYNGGVYDGDCFPGLTMGMPIVGLGTINGEDYWLLKNHLGKTWGESGYVRVKRGVNQCGIANNAVAGDVEKAAM